MSSIKKVDFWTQRVGTPLHFFPLFFFSLPKGKHPHVWNSMMKICTELSELTTPTKSRIIPSYLAVSHLFYKGKKKIRPKAKGQPSNLLPLFFSSLTNRENTRIPSTFNSICITTPLYHSTSLKVGQKEDYS